jgi:hypothetical protein
MTSEDSFTTFATQNTGMISAIGSAVGGIGKAIGDYRGYSAEGAFAQRQAKRDAFQIMGRGYKLAGRARAVAGAQGTTAEGNPLDAELEIIQNANTDARARLLSGNIDAMQARQKAIDSLYKSPQGLLDAIKNGTIDPKDLEINPADTTPNAMTQAATEYGV